MLLVTVVMSNHERYAKIAIVSGCLRTDDSNLFSYKSLRKNIIINPNNKGSVGKNIPTPPNSNSSKFNDKGVVKTITHINLSVATNANKKMIKAKGTNANQYCSIAIKALFAIINKKLLIKTQFDFK